MLHLATRCLLLFITRTLYFYGKRRKTEKIVQDPMTDEGNLDVIQISADALPHHDLFSTQVFFPSRTCFLLFPSPDIYLVMMEFYGFISLFQLFPLSS
jgi:hypothetical protein